MYVLEGLAVHEEKLWVASSFNNPDYSTLLVVVFILLLNTVFEMHKWVVYNCWKLA